MWFALSLIALFIGYCWYDGFRASLLDGSEWSNGSDDGADQLRELAEFLDESLETKREDYQGWHDACFLTPHHVLPTTNHDWESTP
jgi:hypothetical protein